MLIEFVSKTTDGRIAAPRGNRGCVYREGERAWRGERKEKKRVTCSVFLSLDLSCYLPSFLLVFLSFFPTTRLFLSLYLSLPLLLSRFPLPSLFLSFSWLGSSGGKACIIRRNSTGINPRTDPIQSSASAPLCRATNLFNHSTERQAAPLLVCGP